MNKTMRLLINFTRKTSLYFYVLMKCTFQNQSESLTNIYIPNINMTCHTDTCVATKITQALQVTKHVVYNIYYVVTHHATLP